MDKAAAKEWRVLPRSEGYSFQSVMVGGARDGAAAARFGLLHAEPSCGPLSLLALSCVVDRTR